MHKGSRAFYIYLAGQGITNFGEAIRLIAITILIFKLTGSGIAAALGIALSAIPSIIASSFAGALGDQTDEILLLVLIDFIRFLTVPLFLFAEHVLQAYLLLVLLSFLDVFYGPSKRKLLLEMTGRKGALKANRLLSGVSGAAYIVGPMTAGVVTDQYGLAPAILIAGICCLISCLLTFTAGIVWTKGKRFADRLCKSKETFHVIPGFHFWSGMRYSLSSENVRELLVIGAMMGLCTISVNLAFYPYAFDVLKVTAKGWSLMITVYYGTNFIAMLLVKYLERFLRKMQNRLFYTGLMLVAIIWMFYAFVMDYEKVLVMQFMEGTIISVCGIFLAARLQVVTDKQFIARASGAGDIFSNMGKLAGMSCTFLLVKSFSFGAVFIFNSVLFFFFAFCSLVMKKSGWDAWP